MIEERNWPLRNASKIQSSYKEERGDILVRGFWAGGKDFIIVVRVTDLDTECCQLKSS